jgi:hypothetical protein
MPGPSYVLDKTYQNNVSGGVSAYKAMINAATDGSKDGQAILPSAASQIIVGVTQEAQTLQYENVEVRILGITKAYANAAINAGQQVETSSAADGSFQAVNTSGTNVHQVAGLAVTSAAAQGNTFYLLLTPGATCLGA